MQSDNLDEYRSIINDADNAILDGSYNGPSDATRYTSESYDGIGSDGDRNDSRRPTASRRGRPPGSKNKPKTSFLGDIIDVGNKTSPKKGKGIGADELAVSMSAIFALVDGARGNNGHWLKTVDECRPVAKCLSVYIDKMPIATAKKLNEFALPITLLVSTVSLLAVPIQTELLARKYAKDNKHAKLPTSGDNSARLEDLNQGYDPNNGLPRI